MMDYLTVCTSEFRKAFKKITPVHLQSVKHPEKKPLEDKHSHLSSDEHRKKPNRYIVQLW